VATGDFGPGRMPPDMFLNCNEEEKRHKERTIRNQNMLTSTICSRDRGRDRAREGDGAKVPLWQFGPYIV
jgi:hypothetical protein